jgi:hypothetical protein
VRQVASIGPQAVAELARLGPDMATGLRRRWAGHGPAAAKGSGQVGSSRPKSSAVGREALAVAADVGYGPSAGAWQWAASQEAAIAASVGHRWAEQLAPTGQRAKAAEAQQETSAEHRAAMAATERLALGLAERQGQQAAATALGQAALAAAGLSGRRLASTGHEMTAGCGEHLGQAEQRMAAGHQAQQAVATAETAVGQRAMAAQSEQQAAPAGQRATGQQWMGRQRETAAREQQGWAAMGHVGHGPRAKAAAVQRGQQAALAGNEQQAGPGGRQEQAGRQRWAAGNLAAGQRAQETAASRQAGVQGRGRPHAAGTSCAA